MPVAYNPGPQPVVIDPLGREIAGHDYRAVDPSDPNVAQALAEGRLVLRTDEPREGDDPRALQAFADAAADDHDRPAQTEET